MEWPMLASLDEEERRALLTTARRRSWAKGEVLVRAGDRADSIHLVAAGRLAVQITTAEGENATLNILGRGDYFGELSLLDARDPRRSATVVALEPVETVSISAAAFRQLRTEHRATDQLLLTLMARRVEELSARLLEALYDGLDRRLCRRLADLAELYADGAPGPVTVPLTQDQLADLVGSTRPSVNLVLQRLAAEGVIALGRGRVTVLDRPALADKAP